MLSAIGKDTIINYAIIDKEPNKPFIELKQYAGKLDIQRRLVSERTNKAKSGVHLVYIPIVKVKESSLKFPL